MDIADLKMLGAGRAAHLTPDLCEKLEARLSSDARRPIANYLLACDAFDRGHCATGVRRMMIAHHAEPALESAALLVFAGLNWGRRREAPLLEVLLDTWEEFRRPEFDRRRKERRLLDVFAEPHDGLDGVSPLARRLWRLPIRTLRAQIREAVRSSDAAPYSLLLAPATV